jgi:predicted phosphodiesterase
MLLAVISDIHANMPALEAVLHDIKKYKPDLTCCLGDLVNQNVWNREVISTIRFANIPCIMGNHDQGIGKNLDNFHFSYSTREEKAWGKEAIAYTLAQLTEKEKSFLAGLPLHLRFDFECADGLLNMLMVHGSPQSINEYVYHFTKKYELCTMIENAGTHILLMGHTHHPYHQVIPVMKDGKKIFLHAVNAGSVGCPKDGDWYGCYVLIEWDSKDHLLTDPEAIKVNIHRVEYDIDTVVHAIQRSPLPLFYAGRLIKY